MSAGITASAEAAGRVPRNTYERYYYYLDMMGVEADRSIGPLRGERGTRDEMVIWQGKGHCVISEQ